MKQEHTSYNSKLEIAIQEVFNEMLEDKNLEKEINSIINSEKNKTIECGEKNG